MTVPIHVDSANDIGSECVAADVYFGDDKLAGADVTTTLLPGGGGERVIKVITRKFVDEPVVTLYLVAGCQGKISRKFVAFADPPDATVPSQGLNQAEAPVVAYAAKPGSVNVGGQAFETGGSTIAQSADRADPPAPARRGRKPESSNKSTATAGKGAATAADPLQGAPSLALSPRAQAQSAKVEGEATLGKRRGAGAASQGPAAPVRSSGERLMLDPVDADALIQPTLSMTAALQGKFEGDEPSAEVRDKRAAAAALWLAMNTTPEQLARDQQRVQELEKRLAGLQQSSAQSQQQITQLQARVREAESTQSSPTLVYALGGLAALLAAAVAVLFLKDRRQQAAGADWWKADAASPAEPTHGVDAGSPQAQASAANASGADEAGGRDTMPAFTASVAAPVPTATPAAASVREPAPTFNIPPVASAAPAAVAATERAARPVFQEPPREVSVEELIDLEQQAEFFIVLGQDDAALDLLESHVQSTTGASPLPFLKLLEIYQRLGKRQDYERVQSEFNQRFNGYAPAWESDLQQGHSLSEYPGIVERLQSLWAAPAKAMDVLERSLTRPDAESETFDLPAYRELLFLYAVARDLSEREPEAREVVDLNLPFVDPTSVTVSSEPETIEPLMATRPVKAQPEAQPMMSLDLSLDDLEPVPPTEQPDNTTSADNGIEFEHFDLDHRPPGKT